MQVVGILATDPTASESVVGPPSTGDFVLTRTTSSGALSLKLSVAGTAVYGVDYTLAVYGATFSYDKVGHVLTINFAAGAAAASIVVTPIDHTGTEPAVTVNLALLSASGFGINSAQSHATVTIAAHG